MVEKVKPGIKISSEKATIETLQVVIKSIRIEKKQMTLAVFRQIPIVDVLNDDGTINDKYSFWGIVRYAQKDEGDLWVVASKDGLIFKGCINTDLRSEANENDLMNKYGKILEKTKTFQEEKTAYELAKTKYKQSLALWEDEQNFLRDKFWDEVIHSTWGMYASYDDDEEDLCYKLYYPLYTILNQLRKFSERLYYRLDDCYIRVGEWYKEYVYNRGICDDEFFKSKKYKDIGEIERDYIKASQTHETPNAINLKEPIRDDSMLKDIYLETFWLEEELLEKIDFHETNYKYLCNANTSKLELQKLDQLFIAV